MAWRWKPDPPSPEYIPWTPPNYNHGSDRNMEFLLRALLRQMYRENNKDKDNKDKKKDDDKKKEEKTSLKDILALLGLLTWVGIPVGLVFLKIQTALTGALITAIPH